jgi:alpha-1,3-rhamnosyl/mannosyltransferase
MRIALNGTALLSPLTGVGRYTHQLAEGLTQHVDLSIFYGDHWSDNKIRTAPVKNIATYKKVAELLIPKARIVSRITQQYIFTKGQKKLKSELYHEPNFLSYKFKGPTVLTVHDLSWIRYPDTHPKDRIVMMDRYFLPSLERAQKIITDSEFIKTEIISTFNIPPEKIESIGLGVESDFKPKLNTETTNTLKKHGLGFKNYILALGTLEPRKNLQLALESFLSIPQVVRKQYPLALVGMLGWKTSSLEKLIEPMLKTGEVRQLGYVSREELIDITASAKLLIYPSIYEGFGLPPLEAMACGTPVIASNVSSIPEVVGDAGLLIDPHDRNQLKEAILAIIDDDDLSARLSKAGLAQSKKFSWEQCTHNTIAIYNEVLRSI